MLLRPQGATRLEIINRLGVSENAIAGMIVVLNDQKGWDIRSFPRKELHTGRGRMPVVYKVVGKVRWNGGYRSFLKEPVR